jgi:uncharacterized repeat protein (TIGR02543 family)
MQSKRPALSTAQAHLARRAYEPAKNNAKIPIVLSTLFLAVLVAVLAFTQGSPGGSNASNAFEVGPLPKVSSDNPFTDIKGNLHEKNIIWAYQRGITQGSPQGSNTYKPLDLVNRGAMASFLRRIVGSPSQTKTAPKLTDIKGNLHEKNIRWLASVGVTQGSPEGSNTYKPLDLVNRGAMATFMYRIAGSPTYTPPSTSPFVDVPKDYLHYKAISWLKSMGLTAGSPQGSSTYKPYDAVNRGSMGTFLRREYEKVIADKTVCPEEERNVGGTCVAETAPSPTPPPTPPTPPTPTPKTYAVTFDANGGTGDIESVKCETTESACTVKLPANAFTKEGNTFADWNTKANGSAASYADLASVTLKSNITLYAQWEANTYTLYLDAQGGAVTPNTKAVTYGQAVGDIPNPEMEGYAFGGWFTQTAGEGVRYTSDTVYNVAGHTTLYAAWTAKSVAIEYVNPTLSKGDITCAPDNTQTYGSAWAQPSTCTSPKTGYTFDAWYTVGNQKYENGVTLLTSDNGVSNAATSPNLTLFAHWSANEYILSFDVQGGDVTPDTKAVTFGQAVGDLPTPTKPAYNFEGWFSEAGGKGAEYTSDTVYDVAGPTTLYAAWTAKIVAIAYVNAYTEKGSVGCASDNTQAYGSYWVETATCNPTPASQLYKFDGWYTLNGRVRYETGVTELSAANGVDISADTPTLTLRARWVDKPVLAQETDTESLPVLANFLSTGIPRKDIESISFTDTPPTADECVGESSGTLYDVSAANNETVMACAVRPGIPQKYSIVIGGYGGVIANVDSSHLFQYLKPTTLNIFEHFDTENIENMAGMFKGAVLPVVMEEFPAKFGKAATDMSDMFKDATLSESITSFPAGFGESALSMDNMFEGATLSGNIDWSNTEFVDLAGLSVTDMFVDTTWNSYTIAVKNVAVRVKFVTGTGAGLGNIVLPPSP